MFIDGMREQKNSQLLDFLFRHRNGPSTCTSLAGDAGNIGTIHNRELIYAPGASDGDAGLPRAGGVIQIAM
jgi:hypothetical protein